MNANGDIQKHIREALQQFSADLPATPANLYDPIRYTLELGGKHMRPQLALMACSIFSKTVEPAVSPAVGLELFHNFTLLHDDIMDNAPLRRSRPTVHAKWNRSIAILSGDALMVEAYRYLGKAPASVFGRVMEIFGTTALEVCEGQQLDMDYETQSRVSIADYLRMIELKTAVLPAACLQIGALCGGAGEADAKKLYEFGRHLGIVFQLQDDVLDVYADAEKFGKQTGGDIISNKKTFLLLKAFELANRYQSEELQNWLLVPASESTEKVHGVKAVYDSLGVLDFARDEMKQQYAEGLKNLDSVSGDEEAIAALRDFADQLMVRDF